MSLQISVNCRGLPLGVLTLGDDLEDLRATVEVSKASLSARYKHIPYPLKLDGGHFVYDGNRITIENFNAAIGNSTLQQVFCRHRLDRDAKPRLLKPNRPLST